MDEASDLRLKNVLRLVFGRTVPLTEIAAPPGWGDRMVAVATEDPDLPPRLAVFYYGEQHQQRAFRAFTAMQLLNRCGFPIPRVYYVGWGYQSREVLLLSDYVEGRGCEGQQQPFFARIQQDFAHTLADLHRVIWHDLPDLPILPFRFTLSELTHQARDLRTPELLEILGWLIPRLNNTVEAPYAVLHGEYLLEDVFAEGTTIRSILGWENAALGDPRIDIGLTSAALSAYGLPYANQFLDAYQQHAGEIADCALWEVFGALRLMTRLAAGLSNCPEDQVDTVMQALVPVWKRLMAFVRTRTQAGCL